MADFRFFINRQGPRGPQGLQGEKGDPGNTFTVSEGVNTPTEYTLIFDGGDGNQFETDNLRNPIVDRGGTYVRYDRDNVTQYIGEPDMAVIDGTPGIVNLAGKDTVTPNASDAVAYELLEKTVNELNTALEGLDDRLDTDEGDISQAKSDIVGLDNRVTTNEGNIASLQSGKADKSTTYTKTEVNNALAGKANAVHTHTVSQITNAGALASQNTVDYQTQVTNKPTIPTVGNGTITLTQGGVTKGTFTTNQSGNSTIDLDAGGTSSFAAGNAINISDNTISVKYDGTTIGLNASGQLQSLVEEPDMTQYYTKSQVDNLIPDVSGKADSSDVGTMFQAAETTTTTVEVGSLANTVTTNTTSRIADLNSIQEDDNNDIVVTWDRSELNLTVDSYDASTAYAVILSSNPMSTANNLNGYLVGGPGIIIGSACTIIPKPANINRVNGYYFGNQYVTDVFNENNKRYNYDCYTTDFQANGMGTAVYTNNPNNVTGITYDANNILQTVSYKPTKGTAEVTDLGTIQYTFPLQGFTTTQVEALLDKFDLLYVSGNTVAKANGYITTNGYPEVTFKGTELDSNWGSIRFVFNDNNNPFPMYLACTGINQDGEFTGVVYNGTVSDFNNALEVTTTTTVTPDYKWENDRFAQYTDYASTQKAGLVKVGNNLSIAADGTLSANTQAPTAGSGISVSGTAVSVNVDNSTITINNDGQLTANLPGAATSNTLGLVQPDGTTIAVDANGVISANIPTPETVDQTYDASSTHAQSGVAIAGAGFINGNIVQSPLEYLPDTTDSLTYQNVNTSTMIGSGKGISADLNASVITITVGTESGTENFNTYTGDKNALISNSSLTWFETELTNGFNFAFKNVISSQDETTVTAIMGHYENSSFIPDVFSGNYYRRSLAELYIVDTGNYYYATNSSNPHSTIGFYLSGTSLTIGSTGNGAAKTSVTITQSEADILNAVTHIRIYRNNYNTSTLALSNLKVVNPTSATPVTDGNAVARQTMFDSGTNIFDAHPESLSLKYDSTTLGVNASNELYALSNTPSNMVTTDTAQTITNNKTFSGTYGLYFGSSYPFRMFNDSGTLKITQPSSGNNTYTAIDSIRFLCRDNNNLISLLSANSSQSGVANYYVNSNGYNGYIFGVTQSGNKYYNQITTYNKSGNVDPKIYRNVVTNDATTLGTNFLLEKDMLDGTTIQYNSTSGKVEVLESQQEGVLPVSDDVTEIFAANYTVIGNPTITSSHVFSTNTANDFLTSVVPFRTASEATAHALKFECQFRPTADTHSNGEGIFCRDSSSDGIRISLNSSVCIRFRTSINGSGALDVAFSNTPLVKNTLYKLTAEIAAGASSGTGTLYTSSDDGVTWTTAETVTLGTNTPLAIGSGKTSLHYFGVNTPGPALPFGGEILLDKMYLEEDGVVIWTPVASTGDITEIGKASATTYGLVKNPLALPNYADIYSAVDYSSMGTTEQTMPSDGWFVCASNPSTNGTRELLINGVAVNGGNRMTGVVPDVGGCYPVRKGDTVKFSGVTNATNTYWLAKLIPFRSI